MKLEGNVKRLEEADWALYSLVWGETPRGATRGAEFYFILTVSLLITVNYVFFFLIVVISPPALTFQYLYHLSISNPFWVIIYVLIFPYLPLCLHKINPPTPTNTGYQRPLNTANKSV